jgi:hypothetical protein
MRAPWRARARENPRQQKPVKPEVAKSQAHHSISPIAISRSFPIWTQLVRACACSLPFTHRIHVFMLRLGIKIVRRSKDLFDGDDTDQGADKSASSSFKVVPATGLPLGLVLHSTAKFCTPATTSAAAVPSGGDGAAGAGGVAGGVAGADAAVAFLVCVVGDRPPLSAAREVCHSSSSLCFSGRNVTFGLADFTFAIACVASRPSKRMR